MRPPLNCRVSGFVQSRESHGLGGLVLDAHGGYELGNQLSVQRRYPENS